MSIAQGSRWQGSPLRAKLVHQVFAAAAARAEWAPLLPAIVGDLAEVMTCHRRAPSGLGLWLAAIEWGDLEQV